MRRTFLPLLLLTLSSGFFFSGCGQSAAPSLNPGSLSSGPLSPGAPSSSDNAVPTTSSSGWSLTVYYTAVESFHTGIATAISGCLDLDCSRQGVIGSYPSDFLAAVKEEGNGRITSGAHAGRYLNWASDVGYWLDTSPRNAQGQALIPFVSAAADASVLVFGVSFRVMDCGTDDSGGGPIDAAFCLQLKQASWQVTDRFEPGRGGSVHLDLYIGEEDQPDFVRKSAKEISVMNATIGL